jgi:hypothetical protein
MKMHKQPASDILRTVIDHNTAEHISFAEIKTALHERGFGLLMVIFALPVSLPLPIPPGLTSLPAIPLLILAVQMVIGMDSPWIPKLIGNRKIKHTTLVTIIEKAAPFLKKIETLLKPRLSFVSSRHGEKIIGLFAAIFSISIMIPVPFTHMVPALGILVMSLGLLSRDGLTIIIGTLIGSVGIAISTVVIFAGKKAVIELTNGIWNFFN